MKLVTAVLAAALVFVSHKPAAAENCLTNLNTSTELVPTTIGTFFQIGGSDVVRAANPPGIATQRAVTAPQITPTGPGGLSCGQGALALGKQSLAIGQGATATGPNSVAIGANSSNARANSVSVGSPANPLQIVNVAPGTAPTDAVNVSQLQTASNNFMSTTNNLQQQINQTNTTMKAGIAMAFAAAALQTGAGSAGAGKVAIGLGGGQFAGTASLSAGIAYSPTKRLNFNAGVSVAPIVGQWGIFGGSTLTLN